MWQKFIEVVDSGFAVEISPRFPVSPIDLQSRQQPTFTDSLALYTFLEVSGYSGPLDMTFETRAILTGACFLIPGTLSMGKLTLNRPSLQSLICNLPDFGRHVTSPNQGLPSLASWGVKRRDPGNEVEIVTATVFQARQKSQHGSLVPPLVQNPIVQESLKPILWSSKYPSSSTLANNESVCS